MSSPSFLNPQTPPPIDERAASWDARFDCAGFTYGARPNQFVAEMASQIPAGAEVVDLGSGEGRNAVWLAEQGFAVTAIDFAASGLAKTQALARQRGVSVETARADLGFWRPERQWDAAVCTYLHLRVGERLHFYTAVQAALRPGGLFIAEWFRPEQRTQGHTSGGPPTVDLLIDPAELEQHFRWGTVHRCEAVDVTLAEGSFHLGPAAVVRFVFERGPH